MASNPITAQTSSPCLIEVASLFSCRRKSPGAGERRTVIITGGSSGLGLCTAMAFADGGWNVGLIARGTIGLQAAAVAIIAATGARVCWAASDVADAQALALAADSLVDQLGQPEVWINGAGVGTYGLFSDVPASDYDRVTAVTYGGTVNGCRTALRIMQRNGFGTILNVCSAMAFHGMPLMTSYAGAKAAVRAFGQALQAELRIAGSPIRVCTVFPPAINTPFFAHSKSFMGRAARPAPPVYQPEVIAGAIYLAASRSGSELRVTGTVIAFSFAQRAFPWLIAFAMTRLRFESQLTCDPATGAAAQETTLFAPLDAPSQVRGAFALRARRWSAQVWLAKAIAGLGTLGPGLPRLRGHPAASNPRCPPGARPACPVRRNPAAE